MKTDCRWALILFDQVRLPVDFGSGAGPPSFRSFRLYLSAGRIRLRIPSTYGPNWAGAVASGTPVRS